MVMKTSFIVESLRSIVGVDPRCRDRTAGRCRSWCRRLSIVNHWLVGARAGAPTPPPHPARPPRHFTPRTQFTLTVSLHWNRSFRVKSCPRLDYSLFSWTISRRCLLYFWFSIFKSIVKLCGTGAVESTVVRTNAGVISLTLSKGNNTIFSQSAFF